MRTHAILREDTHFFDVYPEVGQNTSKRTRKPRTLPKNAWSEDWESTLMGVFV